MNVCVLLQCMTANYFPSHYTDITHALALALDLH